MSYLIQNDYKKIIQTDNLLQVLGQDLTILASIQLAAQNECISYLSQKYDTTKEFTDTKPWSFIASYKAKDRVYLDALPYNPTLAYPLNNTTLYAGNVYICTTAITAGEAFNITKWVLLGAQYQIFFITIPQPEFFYQNYYAKGNMVFWMDKVYTCVLPTVLISHDTLLQAGSYANTPPINVFPNDPVNGVAYWGAGVTYAVAAPTLPTDTTKWTAGDNRNPQLVNYCIDIALYHVHSRIAPRNIPELRVKRRDEAIKWLEDAAQGKYITADLPLIQPRSGGRIRYGGNTKISNFY